MVLSCLVEKAMQAALLASAEATRHFDEAMASPDAESEEHVGAKDVASIRRWGCLVPSLDARCAMIQISWLLR